MIGPLVVGTYVNKFNVRINDYEDRKASTLVPFIEGRVEEGSSLVTDE